MAEKKTKSQAGKAVSSAKNTKKSSAASTGNKNAQNTKTETVGNGSSIPGRWIVCGICLALFVLFLVIFFEPEGALVKLIANVIYGLFGKVAFLVSIPALLYLFFIHAFSGKRPVIMRSVCLGAFVVCCGCISHLTMGPPVLPSGFKMIGALYEGGIANQTGGVVCGMIASLLYWTCHSILSYIILTICAIFTLLGAMQITIPSIIRAIQDRPRAEWEEEKTPQPEPAAVVVNHLARKHIAHLENKRAKAAASQPVKEPSQKDKFSEIMRQIDIDIESPVAAAEFSNAEPEEEILPEKIPAGSKFIKEKAPRIHKTAVPAVEEELAPSNTVSSMPELKLDDPIEQSIEPPAEQPVQKVKPRKVTAKEADAAAVQVANEIAASEDAPAPFYCFPPIELLKRPAGAALDGTAEMRENSRRLNETLASFKIEAHITNVTRGPSVTRYDVELEQGVRLSKLTSAADDIALSLGATGVRIAPVPGKISVVGIEVPNKAVNTVSLREVIDSPEFSKAKSKSSFAVGKDIGGSCIVGNIAKLPHMLIAGTTGSGKSVCMNSIIISLLYKASPDDVKLIMIDPKMVELGIYNGIPHLLIPVVTDPKKAAGSLQWAVTEMMRRYKALSDAGVRDLESYNSIVESQQTDAKKLPQVVVIIDELADLMLVAAKEVEESICRIAQMGRAAGIHLVIATQRPSADVITGLMKANIPSRIAFAVASAMESRIILDTQGAEKLVGKGDMLFAPIGCGKPKRVQGCFVSDSEVEAVASYVKENYTSTYDQQVIEEIEKKAAQTGSKNAAASEPEPNDCELEGDEMLPAAVDVILETGQASVSMLQRRLKLGYARAARIVDEMAERGIVGPFQGSKPRAILITKEQWEAMKSGQSTQMAFDDMEALDMGDTDFE